MRIVAFVVVATGLAGCRASPARIGAAAPIDCGAVLPRTIMTADGFAIYIDGPQVVRWMGGIYILGSPAVGLRSDRTPYRAPQTQSVLLSGARIGSDGSVSILPSPVDEVMSNALAVADSKGRVTMLWADADSMGGLIPESPIRWSRWEGDRWTPPLDLAGTANLEIWKRNSVSPPVTIGSTVTLFATFGLPVRNRHRMLVSTGDDWTALPLTSHTDVYTSVVALHDTLFVASVDYGAPDGNAVYVKRSNDRGRTFLPRVRVSPAGAGAAYDPRIFRLPTGRMVVVWTGGPPLMGDNVMASSSLDGATWSEPDVHRAAGGISGMRATSTASGKIIAVAFVANGRQQIPTYLEWKYGGWSRPLRLITDSNSTFGIPAVDGAETVVVAWAEVPLSGRNPVTKYVILPGDCLMPGT